MIHVVTYKLKWQRLIDKVDAIADDIHWATIGLPLTIGTIVDLPWTLLSNVLTDISPVEKTVEIIKD